MPVSSEQWSCLIIRAWSTADEPGSFRARLVELTETDGDETTVAVASDPTAVVDATRIWIERVARGEGR
jgi:hypothetical protein